MKKIKSIRILGVDIPIVVCSTKEKNNLEPNTWGEYDSKKLEIRVESSLADDHKKIVILHEAIHCIDDFLDLNLSHRAVYALSQCFFALLKENSKFIEWIYGK